MKEINGQLYGYSYELNSTTEADLTTCYAVDSGKIFIAFGGVWYEQPSFWAAQLSPSASDEYGYSYELGRRVADADLQIFNALDTGDRYVSFQGRWYKQPVQWSAPASGGGGGGGDEVFVVNFYSGEPDPETWEYNNITCDKSFSEILTAHTAGKAIYGGFLWADFGDYAAINYVMVNDSEARFRCGLLDYIRLTLLPDGTVESDIRSYPKPASLLRINTEIGSGTMYAALSADDIDSVPFIEMSEHISGERVVNRIIGTAVKYPTSKKVDISFPIVKDNSLIVYSYTATETGCQQNATQRFTLTPAT